MVVSIVKVEVIFDIKCFITQVTEDISLGLRLILDSRGFRSGSTVSSSSGWSLPCIREKCSCLLFMFVYFVDMFNYCVFIHCFEVTFITVEWFIIVHGVDVSVQVFFMDSYVATLIALEPVSSMSSTNMFL